MEEREARRENVQLEKKGVKYRRDGEEDSPRRVGRLPLGRWVTREGGARSPSRITDRREGGKAKSCGIYVAVAVTPLPNYYLVIFLSECSVNALHRNTANRSGWIDRPSLAISVSIMWTLHLTKTSGQLQRKRMRLRPKVHCAKQPQPLAVPSKGRRKRGRKEKPHTSETCAGGGQREFNCRDTYKNLHA